MEKRAPPLISPLPSIFTKGNIYFLYNKVLNLKKYSFYKFIKKFCFVYDKDK
jgi:hypothetical protein